MTQLSDEEILQSLRPIISRLVGADPEKIVPAGRLGQDLGFAGDDVSDLVVDIHKTFGVDLSEIDSDRYFPGEDTFFSLWPLQKFFGLKSRLDHDQYDQIHVTDLVEAIQRGSWKAR